MVVHLNSAYVGFGPELERKILEVFSKAVANTFKVKFSACFIRKEEVICQSSPPVLLVKVCILHS